MKNNKRASFAAPVASMLMFLAYTTALPHSIHFNHSTGVRLASEGERCGYDSDEGAVCGDGLCCSIDTQTCGSSLEACGAVSCMALYSTGCDKQGLINAELMAAPQHFEPPAGGLGISGTPGPSLGAPRRPGNKTVSPFPPLSYLRSLPRPRLGSVPYGEVITTCAVPGTLALTFDDGPWRYTEALLDLLGREGARATFFVCGGNMAADQLTGYGHPRLLRRMLTGGHQVGSHTWAHPDLAALPDADARRQMWLNEQALVGVLGLLPTYFRPPYLSWAGATLGVAASLGYHVAGVDVDTRDWVGDYDAARRAFAEELAGGGRIVLAHDIREQTVHELAGFMIRAARARGFRLVTLGECLGDDRANWYRNPYDGRSWLRDGGQDRRPRRPETRQGDRLA